MGDIYVEWPEDVGWKVADVGGDDGISPTMHGGGHHVLVVGVGERHRVFKGPPIRRRVRPRR